MAGIVIAWLILHRIDHDRAADSDDENLVNLRREFEDDLRCRREADQGRLQLGQEQQQGTKESISNSGTRVLEKCFKMYF